MRYQAKITVDDPLLASVLEPEFRKQQNSRASVKVSKKGGQTIVEITAVDAVALRADLDSVAQLLKVYEKMGKAK
jgi:tRNA threonylcarbamoyladenosine modification (KEOPS) complex  Pcc1 subunit